MLLKRHRGKIQPYPGTPDFAYLVADRICDPMQDSDCVIHFYGKKRSGKSTNSVALAEAIAICVGTKCRQSPDYYFPSDGSHIRSVSRMGGLDILTSPEVLKDHCIMIIDDARISQSNRNSQSTSNKLQNDIITIMRPFRGCLIMNSVYRNDIDKGSRGLADYVCKVEKTDPYTQQSLVRVYMYEEDDDGNVYKKYLTWRDENGKKHRLKFFVGTLPSPALNAAYKEMRKINSISLVGEARKKYEELIGTRMEGSDPEERRKNSVREIVEKNRPTAIFMRSQGMSMRAIGRELGLNNYQLDRCLSKDTGLTK